jgi:diacylglycerol kinase family enzyme
MRKPHVIVISNPASGANRKRQAWIDAHLSVYPWVRHHVTGSVEEAEAAVLGHASDVPDVVVINGGDGTIATTLGMILRHWPADRLPFFMLLPGGTANMTAGDIGMASSHRRALRRFLGWLDRGAPLNGKVRERCIMRVEGAADGLVRHGMFLGTGAIMQATRFAHSNVHARGLSGEFSLGLVLLRSLWGLIRRDPRFYQPTAVRMVFANGQTTPLTRESRPMLIVVASTLERLFLDVRPFWSSGAGAIRLTAIRSGAARLPRALFSVLRGRPNRHVTAENGYESFRADQIELGLDGELNLDGELFSAAGDGIPLVITAAGPIPFMRPR